MCLSVYSYSKGIGADFDYMEFGNLPSIEEDENLEKNLFYDTYDVMNKPPPSSWFIDIEMWVQFFFHYLLVPLFCRNSYSKKLRDFFVISKKPWRYEIFPKSLWEAVHKLCKAFFYLQIHTNDWWWWVLQNRPIKSAVFSLSLLR